MRTRLVCLALGAFGLGWAGWSASAQTVQAATVVVKGTVVLARASGDNADVAISLKPLPGTPGTDAGASAPRTRPRILQQNKRFSPHMLVVPAGTVVDFPNADPFFHNAFSLFEGKRFDLGLYEGGTSRSVTFSTPGICYIFCNIHPEMSAVVVVVDTPYSAVSNRAGEFTIRDVPPGRYVLSAWHERNKAESPREVNISGATVDLGPVRLVASDDVIAPHLNKYGNEYLPVPALPGTGYIIVK